MKRKTNPVHKPQNIKRTLQGITTVGYLLLMGKDKVQTTKGKPKLFKSKAGLKLAQLALQTKERANKIKSRLFNQCWLQVGIFESRIESAKQALKNAKGQLLNTQGWFVLHVNLCKAYLHLRTYRMSLPRTIVNFLF